MKDTIFLVMDHGGVRRMTKSPPTHQRGEIAVKVLVEADEKAFSEPTIVRRIVVDDWRDGLDLADVEFRQDFITPEEAEAIRAKRLAKMQEILEDHGYKIEPPVQPAEE